MLWKPSTSATGAGWRDDQDKRIKTANGMTRRPVHWICAFALLALLSPAGQAADQQKAAERAAYLESVKKAEALYEDRCANAAGEKIYKTVDNVEGILLMKVRPLSGGRQWADQYWPGAAFAHESGGGGPDRFIQTFLWYEGYGIRNGTKVAGKVSLTTDPTDLPGYRYVDVVDEKDGKRYRYTGSEKVVGKKDTNAPNVKQALSANPDIDLRVYRWMLDKTPAPDPAPRYAVTFDDHVIPEERALWLASGSVKVVDLKTNEVLGEMTRYVWGMGPASGANPSPWLSGKKCGGHSNHQPTRFFVDQVLLPAKVKQP